MMTMERILNACKENDIQFAFLLSDPEKLIRTDCISEAVAMRCGSHTFPSYGITVTFKDIEDWERRVLEDASCGAGI